MKLKDRKLKDGRVCIHWLMSCEDGPIETVGTSVPSILGPIKLGGMRGRIVCHPKQNSVNPQHDPDGIRLCYRSDDPRAVTCPECMASPEFKAQMDVLEKVSQ